MKWSTQTDVSACDNAVCEWSRFFAVTVTLMTASPLLYLSFLGAGLSLVTSASPAHLPDGKQKFQSSLRVPVKWVRPSLTVSDWDRSWTDDYMTGLEIG